MIFRNRGRAGKTDRASAMKTSHRRPYFWENRDTQSSGDTDQPGQDTDQLAHLPSQPWPRGRLLLFIQRESHDPLPHLLVLYFLLTFSPSFSFSPSLSNATFSSIRSQCEPGTTLYTLYYITDSRSRPSLLWAPSTPEGPRYRSNCEQAAHTVSKSEREG